MTAPAVLGLVLGLVAACGRPSARILCHNANCRAPTAPNLDDTIQALRQSLAMRWNREPLLDGVEIDLVWDAEEGRCAFSHDTNFRVAAGVDAVEAISEVANHLLDNFGQRRFTVKLEAKGLVAPSSTPHSADEAIAHAGCLLDAYEVISVAAEAAERRLTVLFESESLALVVAIKLHERFPHDRLRGSRDADAPRLPIEVGFMIPFSLTPPPELGIRDIAAIAMHWEQVHDGYAAELRDLQGRGIDVVMWMYDGGIEALDTIEHVRPRYVNTNEALLLREWLGPSPEDD